MPTHLHRVVQRSRSRRRGLASLLAMLYIVLFAMLAVGFYATATMSVQMAGNDERVAESQYAAESGLQFIRRQFNIMNVSPSSDPATAFGQIYTALTTQLDDTANMNGHDPNRFTTMDGKDVICIPGASGSAADPTYNWMSLGDGVGEARVMLIREGSNIDVLVYGRNGGTSRVTRALQCTFKPQQAAWVSPGAGIITRSPVVLSNGARITGGDVTVATAQGSVPPLNMSGGARIDRDFYYTANPRTPTINNGASVGGQIYPNTPMPSFPTVDGSVFESFVPSATEPQGPKVITAASSISSTAVLTNIRIKANANKTFGNAVKLNGVIYIESPNKVSFGGGITVTGIIVTDGNANVSISQNQITLDNGVRVEGVENLDPAAFSATERIAELRNLRGALVLAPNYKVVLAGGSRTYNGTMVASNFDISNGYRGTIAGSLINLADTNFTMVGGGQITFTGGGGTIPGLSGGNRFRFDMTSYLEIIPN